MSNFPGGIKSLLSIAARSGSPQVVELLIKSGANVNSLDESGNAPIHWAATGGFLDVIHCLSENGADLNLRRRDSRLALHCAIDYEQKEVIDFLLNQGVKIDECASVMLGRVDIIKKFISQGFNVNKTYKDLGGYPITDAIRFQQIDTVEFLIQTGADLHIVLNNSGDSVLHLYRAVEDIDIFNLLISSGADISSKNKQGFTPLHVAARSSCLDVVKRLVELGADVNSVGEDGSTPLWQAAYSQNQQTVEYLLLSGSQVNISDGFGKTPLQATIHRRGGTSSAHTLIAHGADVNVTDQRGLRAIHIAAAQGNDELVRLLLEHGANIS
ncbi:ankyrin repeat domain-containing protein [Leptolyngbyaceae cyanobacterium UHCC 1019]